MERWVEAGGGTLGGTLFSTQAPPRAASFQVSWLGGRHLSSYLGPLYSPGGGYGGGRWRGAHRLGLWDTLFPAFQQESKGPLSRWDGASGPLSAGSERGRGRCADA